MSELKPCPFCGNDAIEAKAIFSEYVTVECPYVKCDANPCVSKFTKKEAISAWNTRADLSQPSVSVEELAELLEVYFDFPWAGVASFDHTGAAQAILARYNVTPKE